MIPIKMLPMHNALSFLFNLIKLLVTASYSFVFNVEPQNNLFQNIDTRSSALSKTNRFIRLFRFCESGHIENKTVARSKSVAFENYLAFLICHFYHSLTKIFASATAVLSAAFKASFFLFALPFSFFCRANCLSFRQLLQFKQSHLFGQRLFAELQKYLINNSSSRHSAGILQMPPFVGL